MKPNLNFKVPARPFWVGRPSEKILRDFIVERLDTLACTTTELSQFLGWSEKFLKHHLKALQKKDRIQNLNGILFTKKTPLGTTLTAYRKNISAQQAHEYNERLRHSHIKAPKSYTGSKSGS